MHEAEKYLRNPTNPDQLFVRYKGKKRRLFINGKDGDVGMVRPKCRRSGFVFTDWEGIAQLYLPDPVAEEQKAAKRKLRNTVKYIREATKASFTNPYIRKCLNADPAKSPYENRITTGTAIDGQLISLDAIARIAPHEIRMFRQALKGKTEYRSCRFGFRGYEGSLSVIVGPDDNGYLQNGDVAGYFEKERKGCLNGFYYLLINDNYFIGYDID